jgi:hypothetical protein
MACMDHTARSRAPVCNEPNPDPLSTAGVPLPRSADQERRTLLESRRANTALALAVIQGMLKNHKACKRKPRTGEKPGTRPLNAVQVFGLEAAIDLLHHYADTLNPENSG